MDLANDPTLALLGRFVDHFSNPDFSDAEFLRQQLAAIEKYVERFPAAERDSRAQAWIDANARQYRQRWQIRAAIDALARERCAACPLSCGDERTSRCALHAQWLAVLRRYAAIEFSPDDSPENGPATLAIRLH